jgi:hypothetical protein
MHHSVSTALATAAAALLLSTGTAFAEKINFSAELSGANEVPPVESSGTGTLEATFDTESMELSWTATYEGLTGDAQAAHFHGPASKTENAGVVVPLEGDLTSPLEGSATLTEEQAQQLQDGLWYLNIHTAKYPDGELRGQVMEGELEDAGGAMDSGAGESGGGMETKTEGSTETKANTETKAKTKY